jgi:hypothetical protein
MVMYGFRTMVLPLLLWALPFSLKDTIDVDQLATNPPLNIHGNPATIVDLQDGTVDDPSSHFNSAISLLLHEMVHVWQYT